MMALANAVRPCANTRGQNEPTLKVVSHAASAIRRARPDPPSIHSGPARLDHEPFRDGRMSTPASSIFVAALLDPVLMTVVIGTAIVALVANALMLAAWLRR